MTCKSMILCLFVSAFVAGCSGSGSDSSRKAEEAAPAPAAESTPPADVAPDRSGVLINPNEAGEAELMSVPRLNAEIVQGILASRPFAGMLAFSAFLPEALDSTARVEIFRFLFLPIDLNVASREEMQLIPGVGPRMSHEFEEYRPWTSLEQFRREIGKYVDEAEVTRLERYIVIAG